MRALLRIFFHFLYHQFAFTYDLVSWLVSFGHWKDWVLEVVPFIEGQRTLEIGHGPGHLHRVLRSRGLVAVAIDESAPMGKLAKRNLAGRAAQSYAPSVSTSTPQTIRHLDYAQTSLTRGLAQGLPFCNGSFDTVIATFPAEYIYDTRTLSEVKRCLPGGGRFVVLPVAIPKNRLLSWLFKVTGQAPSDALEIIREKIEEPFIQSEFEVKTHIIEKISGTLIIIVATKENHVQKTS